MKNCTKNAEKRTIYFCLYATLLLNSMLFVFNASAMFSCDRDIAKQVVAMRTYDRRAEMQAQDTEIRSAFLSVLDPGSVAVICPMVQKYADSLRISSLRGLKREALERIEPSTEEEQKKLQEQLTSAVFHANMQGVVSSLENGAYANDPFSEHSLLTSPTKNGFSLPIARLLFAEGAEVSVEKLLISKNGDNAELVELALAYGEQLSKEGLGNMLVYAAGNATGRVVERLLMAGANIDTAKMGVFNRTACSEATNRFQSALENFRDGVVREDKEEQANRAVEVLGVLARAGDFDGIKKSDLFSHFQQQLDQAVYSAKLFRLVQRLFLEKARQAIVKGQQERDNEVTQCLRESQHLFCVADIIAGLAASYPQEKKPCSKSDQLLLE